ncbi:DUF1853 family protein [Rubripirellula amarantea]|nr:DUF1853 family protein [Rubripirellula amarantea]
MQSSQHVRDLTWAINSRSLINTDSSVVENRIPSIDPDTVDPDTVDAGHLSAFLADKPMRRVGRYFELLILYWLQHIRCVDVVEESLQVREGNRTLGEIDFLFRDEEGCLTHWEVAIKYYLYHADDLGMGCHYIGPNAADTFDRKMKRLFEHQLPRSEVHFPEVQRREAFVKGRIFYQPAQPRPLAIPQLLSPDHHQGAWVYLSQLSTLPPLKDERFKVLRKPYWLSDETAAIKTVVDGDDRLLCRDGLRTVVAEQYASHVRPVLISQLQPDGQHFVESTRIFVMPDRQ